MATPRKPESEKKKGGRPPKKLTQEQIVQVEALAAYLTDKQIADYLSVGITTFYEIMERQPEVSERYKKGKSKAIGVVAKSLMKNIQEGKEASIIFFLKTKGGWTETQKLEHTGKHWYSHGLLFPALQHQLLAFSYSANSLLPTLPDNQIILPNWMPLLI